MKILITGATGCLGRHLVSRLKLMPHYEVIALGRNSLIGNTLIGENTTFVKADIRDKNTLFELTEKTDIVIHCAALANPWGAYSDFYDTNVIGTQNITNAALNAKVKRFIHISTPSIYFNGNSNLDVKENHTLPKKFINYYAKTKHIAECVVDQAYAAGLPTITLRPRAIFGPYDTAIFPRIIRLAEQGQFPLINDGKAIIDITYVSNVVDAILLSVTSDESTLGKKYNITNGEPVVLKNILTSVFLGLNMRVKFYRLPAPLAQTLALMLETIHRLPVLNHHEPIITCYSVGVLNASQTLNIDAARNELGYIPRVSVEQGLAIFLDWWRTHGHAS